MRSPCYFSLRRSFEPVGLLSDTLYILRGRYLTMGNPSSVRFTFVESFLTKWLKYNLVGKSDIGAT